MLQNSLNDVLLGHLFQLGCHQIGLALILNILLLLLSLLLSCTGKLILLENLVLCGSDGLRLAVVVLFLEGIVISLFLLLLCGCFEAYFGDISALTIC